MTTSTDLRNQIRITGEANTRHRVISPAREVTTGSAVIATTRPLGIVIDGEGVERWPTVVKAPLRDFAQKPTHRWFAMWQAGLLAQISVGDETRDYTRACLA